MRVIELTKKQSNNAEIHLKSPDNIKISNVKVIVMYENTETTPQTKKRVFGQFRGKIKISDSFDDELGDGFWLGKENY